MVPHSTVHHLSRTPPEEGRSARAGVARAAPTRLGRPPRPVVGVVHAGPVVVGAVARRGGRGRAPGVTGTPRGDGRACLQETLLRPEAREE